MNGYSLSSAVVSGTTSAHAHLLIGLAWLVRAKDPWLLEILDAMMATLTIHVQSGARPEDGAEPVLHMLELMHSARNACCEGGASAALRHEAFHCGALSQLPDLRAEYLCWSECNGHAPGRAARRFSRAKSPKRSYLEWPFLFSPAVKMRLVRIAAVTHMSQAFQVAFVHNAWVFQAEKMLDHDAGHTEREKPCLVRQATNPYLVLEVRRENVLGDALAQLELKQAVRCLPRPQMLHCLPTTSLCITRCMWV